MAGGLLRNNSWHIPGYSKVQILRSISNLSGIEGLDEEFDAMEICAQKEALRCITTAQTPTAEAEPESPSEDEDQQLATVSAGCHVGLKSVSKVTGKAELLASPCVDAAVIADSAELRRQTSAMCQNILSQLKHMNSNPDDLAKCLGYSSHIFEDIMRIEEPVSSPRDAPCSGSIFTGAKRSISKSYPELAAEAFAGRLSPRYKQSVAAEQQLKEDVCRELGLKAKHYDIHSSHEEGHTDQPPRIASRPPASHTHAACPTLAQMIPAGGHRERHAGKEQGKAASAVYARMQAELAAAASDTAAPAAKRPKISAPSSPSMKGMQKRQTCLGCGTHQTPQWRCGPTGPRTLCNACGVKYKKGAAMPLMPVLPADSSPSERCASGGSVSDAEAPAPVDPWQKARLDQHGKVDGKVVVGQHSR